MYSNLLQSINIFNTTNSNTVKITKLRYQQSGNDKYNDFRTIVNKLRDLPIELKKEILNLLSEIQTTVNNNEMHSQKIENYVDNLNCILSRVLNDTEVNLFFTTVHALCAHTNSLYFKNKCQKTTSMNNVCDQIHNEALIWRTVENDENQYTGLTNFKKQPHYTTGSTIPVGNSGGFICDTSSIGIALQNSHTNYSSQTIQTHNLYDNAISFDNNFELFFDSVKDGQCGINVLLQIENLIKNIPSSQLEMWPKKGGEHHELDRVREKLVKLKEAREELISLSKTISSISNDINIKTDIKNKLLQSLMPDLKEYYKTIFNSNKTIFLNFVKNAFAERLRDDATNEDSKNMFQETINLIEASDDFEFSNENWIKIMNNTYSLISLVSEVTSLEERYTWISDHDIYAFMLTLGYVAYKLQSAVLDTDKDTKKTNCLYTFKYLVPAENKPDIYILFKGANLFSSSNNSSGKHFALVYKKDDVFFKTFSENLQKN